jgi:dTDP-4-amino-4,6-dideoxygalactose transaminase
MKVDLIDLPALHAPLEAELLEAVAEVVRSGRYILGPKVEELESAIAEMCGVGNAVGVSSGTDALLVSLMALEIGSGDRVITSPFTFVATADCIARLGAKPVFVDLEPGGFNLDVSRVAQEMGRGAKCLIPVHLYGRMADMARLTEISQGVPIVEDAAQSLGARRGKLRAGGAGSLGCFSFFPTKNLGALGDGGMVTTGDDDLAEKVRMLRAHGGKSKKAFQLVGGNFRLDALQAAALLVKLPHLQEWTDARRTAAKRYRELFDDVFSERLKKGKPLPVAPPVDEEPDERCVWNQYVIRTPDRDELAAYLKEHGVGCHVYYRRPLHLEECFAYLGHQRGDFPNAEKASEEVLALPIHPALTPSEQEYVVETIANFYADK